MQTNGKNNILLAYVCLVGIPLLALLGILYAGRNLYAPIALGGAWHLQADLRPPNLNECTPAVDAARHSVLIISQSGKYLTLVLHRLQGSGTLQNGSIIVDLSGSTVAVPIRLDAHVGGLVDHDLMTGTINVKGCPARKAVPFRAVRRGLSATVDR